MISRRALETGTALLTGAFGVTVAASSLDNGVSWTASGVEAGTFPFITGLIVVAGSLFNLARGWWRSVGTAISLVEAGRSAALLVPAIAYVAVIPLAGLYVASAVYLFGTPYHQSRVPAARSLAIAAVATFTLYVVFERMFQVSLPHGLLGAALGL
jgi:hypothetical protein